MTLIRRVSVALWVVGVALGAPAALANKDSGVVRWVDSNGEVHFGQRQFAPAIAGQDVESVKIQPANGMDVPANTQYRSRSSSAGPSVALMEHRVKKNPRGFRGFDGRSSRSSRGNRTRNRTR
ncbi:MAG: DUF4124 domain-containing protein [Pseudomonadota bacterium]